MQFLQFVYQDDFENIKHELGEMTDSEIDEFGSFLYSEFFDSEEIDDGGTFELADVEKMIRKLGPREYDFILDLLEKTEDDGMEESVSRVLKKSNINHKTRSFMSNSKADLRKTKAERRRNNRLSRVDKKRYYRVNKKKIQSYQKSRNAAIKSGQHKVKLRHNT